MEHKNEKRETGTKKPEKKKSVSNCECCANFVYNAEYECFECIASLDEDEMVRFLSASYDNCPYFVLDDEYRIARKQ